MNLNYNEVPNIISGKDLDYLSDMFTWNYGAYKNVSNNINSVNDEEIKNVLQKASNLFLDNMNKTLEILEGGSQNG
ncbi:MAG: hypothetical protein HFJ12_04905 [Bacilli bacterium]|nr:hypothetical protein [Bacilli bacterium]